MDERERFAVGATTAWRGQAYRLIAVTPRHLRDGRIAEIYTWRSRCKRCGAAYETTTREMRPPAARQPDRRDRRQCAQERRAAGRADYRNWEMLSRYLFSSRSVDFDRGECAHA